jgi:uncharacterized protein involved in exopolysaccharide biosynthesis
MDFLYSLYDALVSIQVPADKARAVVDSMERDMTTQLATKTDLVTLRTELRSDTQFLRQEFQQESALIRKDMQLMESRLTVRLGSIMVVGMGMLFAALKLG